MKPGEDRVHEAGAQVAQDARGGADLVRRVVGELADAIGEPEVVVEVLQLLVLLDVVLQVVGVLGQLLDEVHALAHERRDDQRGEPDRDEQDGHVDDRDRQAAAHAARQDVHRARERDRDERREDDPRDRLPQQPDEHEDADDAQDDEHDAQHRARRGQPGLALAAFAEEHGRGVWLGRRRHGRLGGRGAHRPLSTAAPRSLPYAPPAPCPSPSVRRWNRPRYWMRCREPRNSARTRSRACGAHRVHRRRVGEQRADGAAERREVARVREQDAALAVDDLVLDPADAAGDDRPVLPHRLGDGEAEALREALLHDDRRVALDRVDDRRVLAAVLHREAREVHAAAHVGLERQPCGADLLEHHGALGVVGDAGRGRPGEDEARVRDVRRDVLGEALHHADRVLQRIPARDLHDQPVVEREALVLVHLRPPLDAVLAPVVVEVGGRHDRLGVDDARGREDRDDLLGRHRLVLLREDVDRRRDHRQVAPLQLRGGVLAAGEDERLRRLDVGQQEVPHLADVLGWARRSRCASARSGARRGRRAPGSSRRSAGRGAGRRRRGAARSPGARRSPG